ncbi:MAG: methylmalonyl-CoA decarboxylase [Deltaproteobacteria bacterium]|nr:methylmalonyl-CoA decarboxylase [Deltaproteobacteria bacterium]MBW2085231.1 methylmalonyl-CoA decarboxylase [Deltaproteobacteria bacterium]
MDMKSGIAELERRKKVGLQGGGKERIERQHQKGHLTARERLDKLLDPGTFWETGLLEQYEMREDKDKEWPTAMISGFGKINGQTVVVHADDRTILAGTDEAKPSGHHRPRGMSPLTPPEVRTYPVIGLGDGGGARIQNIMGSYSLLSLTYPITRIMSPRRAPHVATIMGYCFGAPTWEAATADFVVMVKEKTCMAVSSPRVLEIALTENPTPEELGGWKLHAEVTGQVDAFAQDDEGCLQIVREFIGYMPSNCDQEPLVAATDDPPDRRLDEVLNILPDKTNRVYDMRKIIAVIADDRKYLELKPYFGKALITCLARMNGRTVGILASQTMYNAGATGPDECDKATSFIVLCDTYNIPLIFISDTPGNLVGKYAESRKIPLKIMRWMEALALATVPKIAIIVRKAYGMAISHMCGTNCGPDFIVAWPTADISFMSPEAAANVVFLRHIEAAEDPEAERERLIRQMEYESAPWNAAARGVLDDVIDPRETRKYIIDCLEIIRGARGDFISKKRLQSWPTGF